MGIRGFIKDIVKEVLENVENIVDPKLREKRLAEKKPDFPSIWLNEGNPSEEIKKPGDDS